MAEEIPLTRDELAGLAADTARFGITGEQNILLFTRTVAKMSVATDLAASEAGTALAKLTKLTGTSVEEVENLGSAINELSNTAATSSSEIVSSMLRSSATLKQMGMSVIEIAALNTAINEVSESSMRAGIRLRTLGTLLMTPAKIEELARVLGMTADEFVNIRNNAPIEIIKMLILKMKEGGEAAGELRDVLGTVAAAGIAGLAENMEGLNKHLDTSNTAYKEGTSLQKEFADASSTTYAKLKMLGNKLMNVGDTIAEVVMPAIDALMTHISNFAEWFRNLSDHF